ncbi:MAG: cysteine--tRNA ligase [Porticoccus sp.]|jgi:cysteinyl-tRNA synthetase|nr:cysteine--tRNA ligase [Porticoccus sp.]
MALQIYNTLTRQKEIFKPIVEGEISMYVCGMTVYDLCHIGHARVLVSFDVVARYLRSQGWKLKYVRNITDVDDKILVRAKENNEAYNDLTERMIDAMHQDQLLLGVLPPDIEPRVTNYINEIIEMITSLIDKGYAYVSKNGDVYYRVSSFKNYGQLSGRNIDDILSAARIESNPDKLDQRDFTLWKKTEDKDAGWVSPWGLGRPGWHIECSAMSTCCLGPTFDIHGGGPDLTFPHHENEIAQSEASTGKEYARVWMHAGAVRVDNQKMSKSLGNFFTIRDVLKRYNSETIRYFLLSSHYRSPINYSEENLIEAKLGLERFYSTLRQFSHIKPRSISNLKDSKYYKLFLEAMDDDFNTREALAIMYELVRNINSSYLVNKDEAALLVGELKALGGILKILDCDPEEFMQGSTVDSDSKNFSSSEIESMITKRSEAKNKKDFAGADRIRAELLDDGIVLEDSRGGTIWRRL